MAGACRPHVTPATFRRGRKCLENGSQAIHDGLFSANHQAVAFLQAVDSAAGAGIDKMDSPSAERFCPRHGFLEVRVAPVDDHVAAREDLRKIPDGSIRRLACGNHDPQVPRLREGLRQSCQCGGCIDLPVSPGKSRGLLRGAVIDEDPVPASGEPTGDIRPHPAQSYHCDFHFPTCCLRDSLPPLVHEVITVATKHRNHVIPDTRSGRVQA